jgi:hypothetical protein
MDDTELDFSNKDVKRWTTCTLDRTEWAAVMTEAKAKLKGL